MGKSCDFFDMGTGSRETVKDCLQISSILHRDDSQLVFFVYPHEEGFVFVVEDTSSVRPVSIETYSFKESISLLEQKMILNQLFSLLLSQFVKRIICSSQVPLEAFQCLDDIFLDLNPLLIGYPGSKREPIQVPPHADPRTLDHSCILPCKRWCVELSSVHIGDVLVCLFMFVVVFDDKIEEVCKCHVRVVTSRVDSDTRVCVFAA